jgi:hypothetical protein
MKLTAENVRETIKFCLFKDGEDQTDAVIVEGIVRTFGFEPTRLNKKKQDIADMLDELPDTFKEGKGGGWSFLNMCETKTGVQWTDFHQTMEELLCLGIGTKQAEILLPKEMWKAFPGGMPYCVIKIS